LEGRLIPVIKLALRDTQKPIFDPIWTNGNKFPPVVVAAQRAGCLLSRSGQKVRMSASGWEHA